MTVVRESQGATVTPPGGGRHVSLGRVTVAYKLEGICEGLSVVEYTAGPGWDPPYEGLGRHILEDSAVYVLEGELTYTLEDGEVAAPAGAFVYLPRGEWFAWRNAGTVPARFLLMFTPAGFEQIFTAITAAADHDRLDDGSLGSVVTAQRAAFGMERKWLP